MTMCVKPTRGRLVPMPNYQGLPETALPDTGATVPEDSYWFRRLREGEVVRVAPQVLEPHDENAPVHEEELEEEPEEEPEQEHEERP